MGWVGSVEGMGMGDIGGGWGGMVCGQCNGVWVRGGVEVDVCWAVWRCMVLGGAEVDGCWVVWRQMGAGWCGDGWQLGDVQAGGWCGGGLCCG